MKLHFTFLSVERVLIADVDVVIVTAKMKSKMQINQSLEKVLEMVISIWWTDAYV